MERYCAWNRNHWETFSTKYKALFYAIENRCAAETITRKKKIFSCYDKVFFDKKMDARLDIEETRKHISFLDMDRSNK